MQNIKKILPIGIAGLFVFSVAFFVQTGSLKADVNYEVPVSEQKAPRTKLEDASIEVYKKTNSAVVNINTKVGYRDIFSRVHFAEGSGSGVIIDKDKGYIVTNYHVVRGVDGRSITVSLANGQTYGAKLKGLSAEDDLALLQIVDPPSDLTALSFASSSEVEVGQVVLAIGNPFGLNRTLSRGIVSSMGRTIDAGEGRLIEDIIQIDADINPGNSGGPLLDLAGNIIGINTAIASKSGDSAGIGFAVASDTVVKVVEDLVLYGKVRRPKIGVVLNDTNYAPIILYVEKGSPADKAGLSAKYVKYDRGYRDRIVFDVNKTDFIIEVEGKKVRTKSDVVRIISKAPKDKELTFKIQRGPRGKVREVKIKPTYDYS